VETLAMKFDRQKRSVGSRRASRRADALARGKFVRCA
jgi:hypothetical protein